jgi:hypothetical protein
MEVGRRFDGREGWRMLHTKLDGCRMEGGGTIGTGILGTGFFMTGCFGRTWLDSAWWAEAGKRFEWRSEGGLTDVRVAGCCIPKWTVVGLRGAGLLGRGFWGPVFYDGFLRTDLVGLSLVGRGRTTV